MYWFCLTLTWICHECTCVPHPEPPSLLPPRTIPLGCPVHQPIAFSIMHQTWTGNSYHIWHYTCFNAMILDAWGWCTGTTQRDGTRREEAGGYRMGNTCILVAHTCWCMAKPIQYCKVINLQLKYINLYLKIKIKYQKKSGCTKKC